MVHFTGGVLLFSAFAAALHVPPKQAPLSPSRQPQDQNDLAPSSQNRRKLQGRFLHITGGQALQLLAQGRRS
jgi:hypothetical protein